MYAFIRHHGAAAVLVAINISPQPPALELPEHAAGTYSDVFGNTQLICVLNDNLAIPAHGWRVPEKL